jgi:NADH dehydrogenase (ubiquinone) 1 alpha subcomplex subunit 9
MSRRQFARTLSGDLSSNWRSQGSEANAMNINVATFGATGHLGSYIHASCCLHGFTNIIPFRFRAGTSGVRMLKHLGDGTVGQNFDTDYEIDKEFVVKSILEKVDNVINVVGAWQEPTVYEHSQSWFSMESVNVEWPRMLARWSREMGILRFVHISMVGADLNSPSKLLRHKAMAEQAVLEEFPTATIIRSTDVFHENDFHYSKYLKAQKYLKVVPVANRGLRIHQPVFAGDIGEAATRALYLNHTEGRIAELGGPVRFTTNDYLRWCSECNGTLHLIAHMPKWMWKIATWGNERLPFHKGFILGTRAPSWNQDWLERQFIDNCAMPERDPELMDWEDFGIPREDLYRMEEKYFITSLMWTRENPLLENGKGL